MDYKTVIEETEKYYLPVFGRYPLVIDMAKVVNYTLPMVKNILISWQALLLML